MACLLDPNILAREAKHRMYMAWQVSEILNSRKPLQNSDKPERRNPYKPQRPKSETLKGKKPINPTKNATARSP